MSAIKKQQSEFITPLNYYREKIDDFEKKLKVVESLDNKINLLNTEMDSLKRDNFKLKNEVMDLHQKLKLNDLEMVRIPESRNENIIDIVENVASKLNFASVESCLNNCYRVHSVSKDSNRSRPIVASFKTTLHKSDFMKVYKRIKDLRTTALSGFESLHQQDSKVLVRKDEQQSSKIRHVASEADLPKLLK
ncbi:hypothetical protein HHI36_002962 [Cryptolaemus montrouzieri]|uniref:Uncharacterized protein n=1 Tax=Cryptolaemus montrouzieri TaxID=559131 RepID=A0ABD2PCK3_9CUCU